VALAAQAFPVMPSHGYKVEKSPSRKVFRAYDIRGPVAPDQLNENLCYSIGLAVGSESMALDHKEIVTGRDGRISSPSLYKAFLAGLQETGIKIYDIGLSTSPLLYFARSHLKLMSAAVLTASHSPKHYNGLKIILNGDTLLDEKIQTIFERIKHQHFLKSNTQEIESIDIKPAYINAIVNQHRLQSDIKIVIDCGNGAGGVIAPDLYRALGAEVISLYETPDGNFPNHHPDPIDTRNLKDLQKAVLANNAECGFAFDGDADRIGIVNRSGDIIVTDRTLMLLADDILSRSPKNTPMVFDVKCSDKLFKHIEEKGGTPHIWTTGHSRIKKKMQEFNAPLAGEMSAHIFFKDNWIGCDDGVLAGARILDICEKKGLSFSTLIEQYQVGHISPEIRQTIPFEEKKHDVINHLITYAKTIPNIKISTVDGLRVSFSHGWGLIRASLTEPGLTLRFEGDTQRDLEDIQTQMTAWLDHVLEQFSKCE
jgi:phosphomannomutase/phosphoglucomutase